MVKRNLSEDQSINKFVRDKSSRIEWKSEHAKRLEAENARLQAELEKLRSRCERLEAELLFIHKRLNANDDSFNKVSVVLGSLELRFPEITKQALEVDGGKD